MKEKSILEKIEEGMKPFDCVVSQRDGYIRVWNCYCGGIMGAYNKQLDKVCAELGYKWTRERTYGNGQIAAADWEDQLRPLRFNIVEVRASQQAAREDLIKFGEAEDRRLALKEGRSL